MERIYIGGLDPPRLTVEEVAARLRSIQGVELVSIDGCSGTTSDDKKFFFVNAKRVGEPNEKDEDQHHASALKLVAKQYHNVKWKGCKLSVEAAKPHFLERLAAERRLRHPQATAGAENNERPHDNNSNNVRIPRHLRIRQRFGEEAYHVDTKPYPTDDWSNFSWSMLRMHKRREKHRQQQLLIETRPQEKTKQPPSETKSKPFMNRAVHLRFRDDDVGSLNQNREVQANAITSKKEDDYVADNMADSNRVSNEKRIRDEGDDESELDITSDSSDEADSSSSDGNDNDVKTSAYVWSDDDEDEGNDEEEEPTGGVFSSSLEDTAKSKKTVEAVTALTAGEKARPYEWSSDEDGSSCSDSKGEEDISPALKKPIAVDEFAAAIDIGVNEETFSDLETRKDEVLDETNVETETTDLLDDVRSNLDILSKLFPDMAKMKPRILQDKINRDTEGTETAPAGDKSEETLPKPGAVIQPGWEIAPSSNGASSLTSKLGLMQRYDPTKASTQKYVVTSTPGEKNEDSVHMEQTDEEEEETTKVESSQMDGGTQHQDRNSKDKIYEQNKLEHIFRQARTTEGVTGFQLSSQFKDNLSEDKADPSHGEGNADQVGGFAFSFDLGNKPEPSSKVHTATRGGPREEPGDASGAFAFSFDVGGEAEAPADDTSSTPVVSLQKGTEASQETEQKAIAENDGTSRTRRRGLILPKKLLDEYERAFYSMNDGNRILEDLEGYRNDGEVHQRWLQERYALTQDWKRKRKYAQSRMQKKMKFR